MAKTLAYRGARINQMSAVCTFGSQNQVPGAALQCRILSAAAEYIFVMVDFYDLC